MNNPPLEGIAKNLAGYGRYGDSQLVHMNPAEVQGIASLVPGGKLTTNPVTGQPEAFLPFLIPLISQFAPAAFSALAAPLAGASGVAGAIGTGLSALGSNAALGSAVASGAMEAIRTGDIKQGLMSGLTSFGVGKAMQGASEALSPGVQEATQNLAGVEEGIASNLTDIGKTENLLMGLTEGTPEHAAALEKLTNLQGSRAGLTAAIDTGSGLTTPLELAQTGVTDAKALARQNAGSLFRESPLDFTKELGQGLMKTESMIPIAIGEGQRAQMEADAELERIAAQDEESRRQDYLRSQGLMEDAFAELESGYPGYTLAGGGIISLNPSDYMARRNGFAKLANEPIQMQQGGPTVPSFNYNFGPGGAASRQAAIRGSRVITPEELALEGRPGFGPEIQYFRDPIVDGSAPAPTPGPTPGPGTPGKGNTNVNWDNFDRSKLPKPILDWIEGLEPGSEAGDVFGPPDDTGAAPPDEVPPPASSPSVDRVVPPPPVSAPGTTPRGEPPIPVDGMEMPGVPPSGSIEDVIADIQEPPPVVATPPPPTPIVPPSASIEEVMEIINTTPPPSVAGPGTPGKGNNPVGMPPTVPPAPPAAPPPPAAALPPPRHRHGCR